MGIKPSVKVLCLCGRKLDEVAVSDDHRRHSDGLTLVDGTSTRNVVRVALDGKSVQARMIHGRRLDQSPTGPTTDAAGRQIYNCRCGRRVPVAEALSGVTGNESSIVV